MQITRTSQAGICVALLAVLLPAFVPAWALPETALLTTACGGGVDSAARTGSALPMLRWAVPPQVAVAHLRAGSSFGTGGGVTSDGLGVVVGGSIVDGIVGGGCTPLGKERGITAKFG